MSKIGSDVIRKRKIPKMRTPKVKSLKLTKDEAQILVEQLDSIIEELISSEAPKEYIKSLETIRNKIHKVD